MPNESSSAAHLFWTALFCLTLLPLNGCAATAAEVEENPFDTLGTSLSRSQRRNRASQIRDAATAAGLSNGWMLAGISDSETHFAHCWSEATWACRGPASNDCGGGPVIAGAGDGACSLRRGGLGLFQFDAGNHNDTLAREGNRILSVAGSVDAAVEFVVAMVQRSRFISDVSTEAEALAWMNGVRVGGADYGRWIDTVTGYYNGCMRGRCRVYTSRYRRYDQHTRNMFTEFGDAFWSVSTTVPETPASFCQGGFELGENVCDSADTDAVFTCRDPQAAGDAQWTREQCALGQACSEGACADVIECGDGICGAGETCGECAEDCGMCEADSCGVTGHQGEGFGGQACDQPEAWRCAFLPRYDTYGSQVCRNGAWLNYHLDPADCGGCCGSYSGACS